MMSIFPRTGLICLENTHNRCGGRVLSPDYTRSVVELGHQHQLKVHLDGARIFNAAVAHNVPVRELTHRVDSVSVCLSKGLAAPVGSVLCGSEDFVARARRQRKAVGGGMRQAGVIAAAGLVALEEMIDRLAEDHSHARRLAQGLSQIPGLSLDLETVETNIVYFSVDPTIIKAQDLVDRLKGKGVGMLAVGPQELRAVTHYGIENRSHRSSLVSLARVSIMSA